MDKREIAILSYEHDASREVYKLDVLGEDFEINVPPENVLMAICAHHEAQKLIEEGVEASILTVGGAAISNKRIIERMNEITNCEVPVEADNSSNSVASNIESLVKYENPFIIICQKFAKLRTYIHSKYHLGKGEFELKDWETYLDTNQLSDFENSLVRELNELKHIPLQRKLVEGVLTVLAYLDPEDGFTSCIALLRQKFREKNPKDNIFKKTGLG
ncbi:MAG: hypothetical protein WCY37_01705 [Candidatus Dojkabacteria bacterium]|jgi:hypothetical protein